ncbi:MAG TPA: hypothetical protein VI603_12385 [Saprospiraceae bacterium]|nr:hypothetical protein [Saprospiraceae bacterium]
MNRILSSLMMLMMTTMLYAQPGVRREMMQDRVEAQRIAFITQKLQLTPDEATKFWPVYNEYKEKQQDIRRSAVPERNIMDVTDAEAARIIEQHFATEESILRLKREYYDKLKNAIPPRKIARLAAAEMEFNRNVLEQIKERMQDR